MKKNARLLKETVHTNICMAALVTFSDPHKPYGIPWINNSNNNNNDDG